MCIQHLPKCLKFGGISQGTKFFNPFEKNLLVHSVLKNLECLKNEKVISESAFIRNVIVAAKVDIESVTLS